MNNLFNNIEHRTGERLVQGVLLHLLNSNVDFNRRFCEKVGLAGT